MKRPMIDSLIHQSKILIYFLFFLTIVLISSCGDISTSNNSDTNSGSYVFSLSWPDGIPLLQLESTAYRAIDCSAAGVDIIVAHFYDENGKLLKNPPDEFPCSQHSGQIDSLPPGNNCSLWIRGENASGTVVYQGEETGIDLVAGQVTHGGEIQMNECTVEICGDGIDQDCDGSDLDCVSISGQIAYYPFNSNANDESGNGYDGIVFGATLAKDRKGNSNRAYSFDGVDDYIKLPQSLLLDITGNDFSYSIWFDSMNGALINLRTNAVSGSYLRKAGHIVLKDDAFSHMGSGSNDSSQIEKIVAINDLPVFYQYEYNHLVFVKSENIHMVYINGLHIKELDITVSGDTLLLDDILVVGKHLYSGVSNRFLEGRIDEIRFYDRSLSLDEIQALYSDGQ